MDYKFLAIFRMSDSNTNYLSPSRFGLSTNDYRKFKTFRRLGLAFYNQTMATIGCTGGPGVVLFLYIAASLYVTDTVLSIIWTIVLGYWIYVVCTVIYSNLTGEFLRVSKLLRILVPYFGCSI